MKEFLLRKKWTLLFFLIIVVFSFILIPTEKLHYSSVNIEKFKNKYYWSVMTYISLLIIFSIMILRGVIYQKFNEVLKTFLKLTFICVIFIFLLQNFLITIILLGNRLHSKSKVNHEYVVYYKLNNDSFFAKNLKTKKIITERDFLELSGKSKLEIRKINIKDTLNIKTNKGIFGIEYY